MAFYEDLSPYNYTHYCEKELNVGWLQKDQPFSIGETPENLLHRLRWFSEKNFTVFNSEAHRCEFCDENITGDCELRIVGPDNVVYACPELIIHYIEVHKYLPPQEFIDAVMNGPRPGQDKYTDAVYRHTPPFWEQRKPDPNDSDYEEKLKTLMIDNMSKEVEQKIIDDLLQENPEFGKFMEAYNKIMPAVYNVSNKKIKS